MKRKILSLGLMGVMITAITATVVSCKDSDFDYLMQQQLDANSTLDEALKAQVDALEQTVQSLQSEQGVMQGVIDALESTVDANKTAIEANQKAIDEATKAIQDNASAIANNSEQLAQHQQAIDANAQAIESNTQAIEENVQAIVTITNNLATAQAAIDVLDKAMDAINDALAANGFEDMNDMASQVVGVVNAYQDLRKQVEQNASDIVKMEENILSVEGEVSDLTDAVASLTGTVDGLTEAVGEINNSLNTLTQTVGTLGSEVESLTNDVSGLQTSVGNLETQVATINQTLENQSMVINELLVDMSYTKALAEANEARLDAVDKSLDDLTSTLESVRNDLTEVKNDITDIKSDLSSVQGSITDINNTLDGVLTRLGDAESDIQDIISDLATVEAGLQEAKDDIAALSDKIDDYLQEAKDYADQIVNDLKGNFTYNTLGEFQEAMEDALKEYQDELEDLEARVTTLEDEMKEVNETINNILSRLDYIDEFLDALQNYLSQQVTSILVQTTVNPIFGTFSMPMNITSNILAAYYGTLTDSGASFPTARKAYYADATNGPFLTSEDLAMLGLSEEPVAVSSDGYLIDSKEGNAGTLYATVNPNTVDFSGLVFGMENSIQEPSGVTLGKLQESDYKITFGYTRAASNGFYEAPATVESGAIAAKVAPRMDINELKEVLNELTDYVKNGGSGMNVTSVLTTLYQQFTDVLDANAIYAEWTDQSNLAHRTYSQYSIAATAIKPLSYSFMGDTDYETFPGINRIENVINKLFENIKIPTFDLSQYKLTHIDPVTYDDNYVDFDAIIRVDAVDVAPGDTIYIYASNGEAIGYGVWDGVSQYIDIAIHLELLKSELYDEPIDDINQVIDAINDALDDINSILDDLDSLNEISSGLDDLQEQLLHYVDVINDWLCKLINSVNTTLQPIILVNTSDGFKKLSDMRSSPSVLSKGNNITLIPTSFTAEIFAPAYKKVVGVTNVYSLSDLDVNAQNGDSTCKSLLDAANSSSSDLAKVIDGDTRKVTISGLKAGYIYEIAFTAVDYSGKVAAQKCYVRIAD